MTTEVAGAVASNDELGAAGERRFIVCFDDEMGACWPMQLDTDCAGALCALGRGKIAIFRNKADARKAIKISTAYARLRSAQGLGANADFLDQLRHVKVVECESA